MRTLFSCMFLAAAALAAPGAVAHAQDGAASSTTASSTTAQADATQADAADTTGTPPEIRARLERMRAAAASLKQYTYTFRRHEWVDGKQGDPQLMAVKFRKPMDIYMTWVGDAHTGRELLYRKGWNDGKMRVHPTPGALIPSLNLDPNGKLATKGSRHGIELIDLSNVTAIILAQTDRLDKNPDLSATFTDQGKQVVNGEASHCTRIDLPKDKDPQLYGQRVDLCLSTRTGLLTRLQTWDVEDGALRKVEDYEFRDLNLSPGLTDADFDPDNDAYGF